MSKPFHQMTPAERTALRIAQNREIASKVAAQPAAPSPRRKSTKPMESERVKPQPPPRNSTPEFTRATPEERALLGGFIRKV